MASESRIKQVPRASSSASKLPHHFGVGYQKGRPPANQQRVGGDLSGNPTWVHRLNVFNLLRTVVTWSLAGDRAWFDSSQFALIGHDGFSIE